MITPKRETLIKTRTHCMDLDDHTNAVQSIDINGIIIDVSPAWLELTGYEKEDVIGKYFMGFLYADSHSCVKKNFPHLKDFGYVDNVQLKIKAKDNKALPVSLTGTSKYDHNGAFERTFCEISLNTQQQDKFIKDIDEFIEDMDEYLERLDHLVHRK